MQRTDVGREARVMSRLLILLIVLGVDRGLVCGYNLNRLGCHSRIRLGRVMDDDGLTLGCDLCVKTSNVGIDGGRRDAILTTPGRRRGSQPKRSGLCSSIGSKLLLMILLSLSANRRRGHALPLLLVMVLLLSLSAYGLGGLVLSIPRNLVLMELPRLAGSMRRLIRTGVMVDLTLLGVFRSRTSFGRGRRTLSGRSGIRLLLVLSSLRGRQGPESLFERLVLLGLGIRGGDGLGLINLRLKRHRRHRRLTTARFSFCVAIFGETLAG